MFLDSFDVSQFELPLEDLLLQRGVHLAVIDPPLGLAVFQPLGHPDTRAFNDGPRLLLVPRPDVVDCPLGVLDLPRPYLVQVVAEVLGPSHFAL